MPKTNFQNGSPVPAEWFNAIQDIQFDGQDIDGHYPPIADDSLSDAPGNLKPEWRSFRDALSVSPGLGLSVNFQGGRVTLPDGTQVTIAPGTLSLPANTASIIHINPSGAVAAATSTNLPLFRIPLALVTTSANGISGAIVDLRPRFLVSPRTDAIKTFGGTGDQGDYVLNSGSATFSDGFYYFRNFTLGAGATLTIDRFARIFCSGTVTIAGTIVVTPATSGGASFGTGSTTNMGGLSGGGIGSGSGSSGIGGSRYNYAVSPVGSGGSSGFISGVGAGIIAPGGEGGGGIWFEAAGTITVSGTVTAIGGDGGTGSLISGSMNISGGGGGSGGLILLSSLIGVTVTPAATLNVRGGAGGNFAAGLGEGGAGGGGGLVVLISPANNATGSTILLPGGTLGISAPGAVLGGGNGGGFGGNGGGQLPGEAGQLILRGFRAVG